MEVKRFSLASRIVLALNSISAAAILSAMSEQLLSKQNTEWFLDFLNLKQLYKAFTTVTFLVHSTGSLTILGHSNVEIIANFLNIKLKCCIFIII